MQYRSLFVLVICLGLSGCGVLAARLFPVWPPNFFDEPPAELGPFEVAELRLEVEDGADGDPFGITVFEPLNAEGALPVFLWVMGSNVQAYYHQSLHETLASWGYLVVVPDTRELLFTDFQYHNRVVLLAEQALGIILSDESGYNVDTTRIGSGGYSVGGPLAAFTAGRAEEIGALVYWAPSGAPFWQGLDADALYANVSAPSRYILGERDENAPAEGGTPDDMQASMPDAPFEEIVIEGANHHQFQQPVGADSNSLTPGISRIEQQRIAIELTLEFLDNTFGIDRE